MAGAADVPDALREVPLIAYAEDLPIVRRYWQTVFGTRPLRNAAMVVPDLRAVLSAVLAGSGFSVLPAYLCEQHIVANQLSVLLSPPVPPLNTLYLSGRSGAPAGTAVSAVTDHLLGRAW